LSVGTAGARPRTAAFSDPFAPPGPAARGANRICGIPIAAALNHENKPTVFDK
jgi:hypothetical protein